MIGSADDILNEEGLAPPDSLRLFHRSSDGEVSSVCIVEASVEARKDFCMSLGAGRQNLDVSG